MPLSLSGAIALVLVGGAAPVGAQDETTITVDTTSNDVDFGGAQQAGDLPGPDGRTSLREATIASTNTAGPETIAFDIPTSDPGFDGAGFVIVVDPASPEEELTIGDDNTTLDATTQPGGFSITVEGGPESLADGDHGLTITSSGNAVIGLGVRLFAHGIDVRGGSADLTGCSVTDNLNGVLIGGAASAGSVVSASTISDNTGTGLFFSNTTGAVATGNTITGNGTSGVSELSADDLVVTGNLISENGYVGIRVLTGQGAMVAGNTITGNADAGVLMQGGEQFTITRNSIADNGRLGIDLLGGDEDGFGVTKNDAKDRDSGANELMNFPERLQATDDATGTVVEGRITHPAPESVTIELFTAGAPDPSGHGEGETFVGTATPDGKGRFTATVPAGLGGQWLTATATDAAGNTSEFSQAVGVAAAGG